MRALVQRVSQARVRVSEGVVAEISAGLLVFLGITHEDTVGEATKLARKIAKLRIFGDRAGKMNLSLLDTGGAALVVSQFTLYADTHRGNRPGYSGAARPAVAEPLYQNFIAALRESGIDAEQGIFGAHMEVELVNSGPVTIWLDSAQC